MSSAAGQHDGSKQNNQYFRIHDYFYKVADIHMTDRTRQKVIVKSLLCSKLIISI